LAKILLVRHGRTILSHEIRFWGKTDIGLSDAGMRQAKQLRDRLVKEKITAVYSSTSSRARDTAEIIASPHRLAVNEQEELCECNFGYIEGLTFEEIKKKHPKLARELAGGRVIVFPGGESLDELNERVKSFIDIIKKHEEKETLLVVAHSGSVRLLICALLGIGIEHWLNIRTDMASLSTVETYPEGNILTLLNDTGHLKT
jgi:alpha-ribazole phosphatase